MSRHLARIRAVFVLALLLIAPTQAADFAPVLEGRRLVFPEDSGAHPDYRTEWWYITGWLTDDAGIERGFQVTFFRVGTGIGADNPSRFAPRQLILAHAAIADPATGHLLHAERAERALEPLSGTATGRTQTWIGDWDLTLENETYRTQVAAEDFTLDLTLIPAGPPVLNGRDGFSQKTPDPANASHYYSRPQLAVKGRLRLADTERPVSGRAWLDHEWSSEILPETAQGWDWIGINLHDGGSLMAFQMRQRDGSPLWAGGTLRQADGTTRLLAPTPVEWEIAIDGRRFSLRPLMDDQELDGRRSTGVVYWEGASRLIEDGSEIGRGYLEMTGYWQRQTGL